MSHDEPSQPRVGCIRLLVADDANRRVLAEWLGDEADWTVTTAGSEPDGDDDLCVVDEASLRTHRPALAAWKADSDVFRPCLLVSERGEEVLEADQAGVVDDVVALPTSKPVLERRIGRLLREREQSVRIDADRSALADQNERLRMFAARLAHDLRNPLGIATGYVEEARSSGDDGPLAVAAEALDRMQRLVDETLRLAKMGETAIERDSLGLGTVAEAAWGQVETGAATLTVDDDGRLEADESRLQELFENLFRNAVEHVGGDVAVHVGLLPDREGFYVADDGPGIDADDREQVFEVGYTTHEDGTGFGLRIIQEICEAHGWSVEATDSEAGGARFEVTGVGAGEPAE